MSVQVAAFYGFTAMAELPALQAELRALAEAGGVRGTILLAEEGVNGTISGSETGVQSVLSKLRRLPGLGQLEAKFSTAPEQALEESLRGNDATHSAGLAPPSHCPCLIACVHCVPLQILPKSGHPRERLSHSPAWDSTRNTGGPKARAPQWSSAHASSRSTRGAKKWCSSGACGMNRLTTE